MPSADTLRAQTTPQDLALFRKDAKNSLYRPLKHEVFTDDKEQKLTIELSDVTSGKRQVKVEIEKDCTLLENVDLVLSLPALVGAGGATYIRYCDFVGLAMIKSYRWKYGATDISPEYFPESTFVDYLLSTDEEKRKFEYCHLGNMSAAERNTFAAAPSRPVRIRLESPWKDKDHQCPIVAGLANKLILQIDFQEAGYFVQTDGTKPASTGLAYTNVYIDKRVINTSGDTRGEFVGLQNTPQGISYMFDDTYQIDYTIPANTLDTVGLGWPRELTDLDGPIKTIHILLREQTALDPTSANPEPFVIDEAYLHGLVYKIINCNITIEEEKYWEVDTPYQLCQKMRKAGPEINQVLIDFCKIPEAELLATGNISFGNFSNPKLYLKHKYLAKVHPALTATVIARKYNWLVHQRGNIQIVWR